MRRKRLESDWIDERRKELKAGSVNSASLPWIYRPFLKGISIDRWDKSWVLSRIRRFVSLNEPEPVSNVVSLGRSIHYININ